MWIKSGKLMVAYMTSRRPHLDLVPVWQKGKVDKKVQQRASNQSINKRQPDYKQHHVKFKCRKHDVTITTNRMRSITSWCRFLCDFFANCECVYHLWNCVIDWLSSFNSFLLHILISSHLQNVLCHFYF